MHVLDSSTSLSQQGTLRHRVGPSSVILSSDVRGEWYFNGTHHGPRHAMKASKRQSQPLTLMVLKQNVQNGSPAPRLADPPVSRCWIRARLRATVQLRGRLMHAHLLKVSRDTTSPLRDSQVPRMYKPE